MKASLRNLVPIFLFALTVAGAAGAEVAVSGRVLDAGGKPVEGARASLVETPSEVQRLDFRLGGQLGPAPMDSVETDTQGWFDLAAPGLGPCRVVVEHPGHLTMEFVLDPLIEAERLPPLTLSEAVPFEVAVVDPAGAPRTAAVAMVRLENGGPWRPRLRLARTGDDGVVRLPRSRGEKVRLVALAEGYPQRWIDLESAEAARGRVRLELAAGVRGTVVVQNPRGGVAPGVVVFQQNGVLPLGKTDDEGRIELVLAAQDAPKVSFLDALGQRTFTEVTFPEDGGPAVVTLREPLLVSGRVVEADRRLPVAGALVWGSRGEPVRSDAHGGFELRVPPVEQLAVRAAADGYGLAAAGWREGDGADGLTLALVRAAAVRGRVTDKGGLPLPDVVVQALPEPSYGMRRSARGGTRWTTSTSARGHFQFLRIDHDLGYVLEFDKPGFAVARHRVGAVGDGDRPPLEVVLEKGRTGLGSVVDEAGAPIAGAEVTLSPRSSGPGPDGIVVLHEGPRTATTDAEGLFRFEDLAPGRFDLEVSAAGFAPAGVPGVRMLDDAVTDFGTVVLVPGKVLEGRVEDSGGVPVSGAEVRVRRGQGFTGPHQEVDATSGADGRFTVGELRDRETIQLTVSKEGYSSQVVTAVAEDGAPPLEVVLEAAATLSGRVLDPDRQPVADAVVNAQVERGTFQSAMARTEDDGRFTVVGVPAGAIHLAIHAPGFEPYQMSGLEVAPGEDRRGLEVVLKAGAILTGVVLDSDGRPLPSVEVSLSQAVEGMGGHRSTGVVTDDAGRFRFEGAPLGPATLTARQGGYRSVSREIEVKRGGQHVELVFEAGFEVSGRVVDETGSAVAGATLALEPTDSMWLGRGWGTPLSSAADGSFVFSDVSPGTYQVRAAKEGFAAARGDTPFTLDGDVRGIELVLRRGATLSGRILGLDLDELAELKVHAYDQGGSSAGQVDYEGNYVVHHLGPGTWQVNAVLVGGRSANGQVTVEEGDTEVTLDLEFVTGFTLSGLVTDGGEPLAGVRVFAYGEETSSHGSGTTDSAGRFLIPHLPAGRYQVTASNGVLTRSEPVEVGADQEVRLELSGAILTGWVRDAASGEPVPGARVELVPLHPDAGQAYSRYAGETDSRGFFRVGAAAGAWQLVAVKAGYSRDAVSLDVVEGEVREGLELRLTPAEGLSFEVVLASGERPRQVQVAVFGPADQPVAAGAYPVTGDGTVRLSTVPPGTWELWLQSPESAVAVFPITVPGEPGSFVLPPAGSLRLRLGELAADPSVALAVLTTADGRRHRLLGWGGVRQDAWPVRAGQTVVPNVEPGTWDVTVTHPDGRTWTATATVTAGQLAEVVVP